MVNKQLNRDKSNVELENESLSKEVAQLKSKMLLLSSHLKNLRTAKLAQQGQLNQLSTAKQNGDNRKRTVMDETDEQNEGEIIVQKLKKMKSQYDMFVDAVGSKQVTV
jgi:hypothetical protein